MSPASAVAPTIEVKDVTFHVLPMRTRFPFQYGIASMTALPHVLVTVQCRIGGRDATGVSADGLPPKWFTKNPATTFAQDLPQIFDTIRAAAGFAVECGASAGFFEWWQALATNQDRWA